MKNLWIAAALAAMFAPAAHASTLTCTTHPTSIGAEFKVMIDTGADQGQGSAVITLSGGRALYMMNIGNYPVTVSRDGAENAVFSNSEKDFELTVNSTRFDVAETYSGNVTMEANGARVNEAVDCASVVSQSL
jgi:hypothetical protein